MKTFPYFQFVANRSSRVAAELSHSALNLGEPSVAISFPFTESSKEPLQAKGDSS